MLFALRLADLGGLRVAPAAVAAGRAMLDQMTDRGYGTCAYLNAGGGIECPLLQIKGHRFVSGTRRNDRDARSHGAGRTTYSDFTYRLCHLILKLRPMNCRCI